MEMSNSGGEEMKTRILDCNLTRDELVERGEKLVLLLEELDGLEAEKKKTNDRIKVKVTGIEATVSDLSSVIRRKKEERDVEVEIRLDWSRKIEETVRLDTWEIIETRTLTSQELQMEFNKQERNTAPATVLTLTGFDHSPKEADEEG
jgi:hypothetical protein